MYIPSNEVASVTDITIPDWDEVDGAWLLRSLDYDEDAAFTGM